MPNNFDQAVIVCDGNSLTLGFQASDPSKSYPSRLGVKTAYTTSHIYNKGVSGQTTLQMTADAATDIDPLYNGSVKSLVIAWEMGNDYLFNGQNAAACETHFQAYCANRKAIGWKVVVLTCPDRSDIDTTGRLNMNSWLANNYTFFADALVDLAADTRFQDYTNTTYFNGDHIHLTDVGYQLVADMVDTQLQAMKFPGSFGKASFFLGMLGK